MIPFNDLKPQFLAHRNEFIESVTRVMESGVYLMGQELSSFESEFADYLNIKYAVGVGSGTDALSLALRAFGIGRGDDVIVPANAYPTAFGVAASGSRLRLCDVDSDSLTATIKTIEPELTKFTKAIVIVHLYGYPARADEIAKLTKQLGIALIEDCAQAVGAKINGQLVGTFGDAGCFSFYPTKNLGAMGDGGAVVTNNLEVAERIRRLRMYGEDVRYHSVEVSTHSRLDEIQAGILKLKLDFLNEELVLRQEIADRYRQNLPADILIPSKIPADLVHANHLFVVKLAKRGEIAAKLREKGIETMVHYPAPIHFQPAFQRIGNVTYTTRHFPVSENASQQILSIPFYPGLPVEQQEEILELVKQWI